MDELKQRLNDIEYIIDFDIKKKQLDNSFNIEDLKSEIHQLRNDFHDFEENLNRKIKDIIDKKINERFPQNNQVIMATPLDNTTSYLNDGGIRNRRRFSRTEIADIPPSTPARRRNNL